MADGTVSSFVAFAVFCIPVPFYTGFLGERNNDIVQVNVRTRDDNQVRGTKSIQQMLDEFKDEVAAYR